MTTKLEPGGYLSVKFELGVKTIKIDVYQFI